MPSMSLRCVQVCPPLIFLPSFARLTEILVLGYGVGELCSVV